MPSITNTFSEHKKLSMTTTSKNKHRVMEQPLYITSELIKRICN